jgi:GT2 family glycosyltransferase
VVVTARDGPRLLRCLSSLEGGTGEIPFEVVVVLNGADDDVVEAARAVRGVRLVASPWNLGFAGASNLGRAHAGGELIVLLHDDAEAEPGWLPTLVAAAERHPEAGVIGSLGAVVFSDASTALARGAGAGPVDYCSSSSVVVRAPTWDAIGGLDELLFPGGYVDADLGIAARAAGWVVRCEPSAVVRHQSGGSMTGGFRAFVHGRNRERFRSKWAVELQLHEPPAPDVEAATERALARAQARAGETRARGVPQANARPAGPDPELGPRLAELELRLRSEYIAMVDPELERVHREYAAVRGELDAIRAGLDPAPAAPWRRLRTRLLRAFSFLLGSRARLRADAHPRGGRRARRSRGG